MTRRPYAALSELVACHAVLAGQVFDNTLVSEQLFASYLEAEPASSRGHSSLKDELAAMRGMVQRQIIEPARALVRRAGTYDLPKLFDERTEIEQQFELLMRAAGVLHDHVDVDDAASILDMTRSWRRLDITDQHRSSIINQVWDVVANTYTRFRDESGGQLFKRNKFFIDFRHFNRVRIIHDLPPGQCYLVMPFWMLHMPRIGACAIAHECGHPVAAALLRKHESNSEISGIIRDLEQSSTHWLARDESNGLIREVLEEIIADMLAARILGPAYVVALAEILLGSVRSSTNQRFFLRLDVLLDLHEGQKLEHSDHGCNHLYDQVVAALGAHIGAMDQPSLYKAIRSCLYACACILNHKEFDQNQELRTAFIEARDQPCARAFRAAWSNIDEIMCRHRDDADTDMLLETLRSHDEVRRFITDAPTPPLTDDNIITRESWSMDWLSLRAEAAPQGETSYAELGDWMLEFAPPASAGAASGGHVDDNGAENQPITGLYALVLGASDGFVLRPGFREHRAVGLNPDVPGGLTAFVERRVLYEIAEIKRGEGRVPWRPTEPWSNACYLSEIRVGPDQTIGGLLEDLLNVASENGVSLVRAFVGLGWANLVVFMQPSNTDGWWKIRNELLGTAERAPSTSISSVICSRFITESNQQSSELTNPWIDCDSSPTVKLLVSSFLRSCKVHDIHTLASESSNVPIKPEIHVTFGIYGGLGKFTLEHPRELSDVTQWLYERMARRLLSRSVSVIENQMAGKQNVPEEPNS